jgi:hypothetical protein
MLDTLDPTACNCTAEHHTSNAHSLVVGSAQHVRASKQRRVMAHVHNTLDHLRLGQRAAVAHGESRIRRSINQIAISCKTVARRWLRSRSREEPTWGIFDLVRTSEWMWDLCRMHADALSCDPCTHTHTHTHVDGTRQQVLEQISLDPSILQLSLSPQKLADDLALQGYVRR